MRVAPRAGAWIETRRKVAWGVAVFVAPRAGAWIETSHEVLFVPEGFFVAPRAGAWIETG